MELKKTVIEFEKSVDTTMEKCKAKLGEMIFEDEFDIDTVEFIKDVFQLCDVSMRLVKEQANSIQEINEKLDKLLERSEN